MTTTFLLDSGAFTARQKGVDIDVGDYVAFVKHHRGAFAHCVNLDVIPGPGISVERAAEASRRNLQVMKDAGLEPWPVFHQGEDFKWLERILADGDPRVCLSPADGRSPRDRRAFVNRCRSAVAGSGVAVHGLGVASLDLVARFPWSSVDASTWARQGGCGRIPVPRRDAGGRPDYTLPAVVLGITDDSTDACHVDILSDAQAERVRRHIEGCGFDIVEVRYSPAARYTLWAMHMERVAAACGLNFFFATGDYADQQAALDRAGARHRLASYWWLRDKSDDAVRRFVEGRPPEQQRQRRRHAPRWCSKAYRARRALALRDRARAYEEE